MGNSGVQISLLCEQFADAKLTPVCVVAKSEMDSKTMPYARHHAKLTDTRRGRRTSASRSTGRIRWKVGHARNRNARSAMFWVFHLVQQSNCIVFLRNSTRTFWIDQQVLRTSLIFTRSSIHRARSVYATQDSCAINFGPSRHAQ
ncbi:hypothetical protein [Paraburkholderia fynbosensis]|uniref:hypothetical protein n=1 Tax=Paraburkholderia fynbosensis TaxID=1200993 RepID=UPI001583FEB2|nr:hypothetical protein [Paraburkholderia fynbosensis]